LGLVSPAQDSRRYPEAVLSRTGGIQPFSSTDAGQSHDFPLKRVSDTRTGQPVGATIQMSLESLGERSYLVDTAARGLLLKSSHVDRANLIEVPEWSGPGPGIQTGVFKLFRAVSAGKLVLLPAVAEIFQAGSIHADGIVSPGIFDAWRIHLNFRENKLQLRPFQEELPGGWLPWAGRLSRTWWIMEVSLDGKPAIMLMDSGAATSTIAQNWSGFETRKSRFPIPSGIAMDIGIAGIKPVRKTIGLQNQAWTEALAKEGIDGILGYDLLHHLSIVLDYRARQIKILH
jgi:hypothetical protein